MSQAPTTTPDATRKAWVTLQARAALAGFTASLIETDDGRPQLVVTRWNRTRAFDCLSDVETWLAMVEGRPA